LPLLFFKFAIGRPRTACEILETTEGTRGTVICEIEEPQIAISARRIGVRET
jgi:hypothetical protein